MTCFVVLNLIDRFKMDERKEMIEVTESAAETSGTTAELKLGDMLSVWDMLHGLMLPSGNDAAMALAEHFG
jgi:D-alanyl-D-alanine carboxypeptidase (penicillin-binding protein 5/6)